MCNASTLNKANGKKVVEKGVNRGQETTSDARTSEGATSQESCCCCYCAVLPTVEAKGGAKKGKGEPKFLHTAGLTTDNVSLMFERPIIDCSSLHANRFRAGSRDPAVSYAGFLPRQQYSTTGFLSFSSRLAIPVTILCQSQTHAPSRCVKAVLFPQPAGAFTLAHIPTYVSSSWCNLTSACGSPFDPNWLGWSGLKWKSGLSMRLTRSTTS